MADGLPSPALGTAPVVLLLAGCYAYVSYANLPIPRAVVLECEELRPPFAPGVLLDVRPVKTGG